MTPDRLDDLLGRSLDTGAIPADATPEERAELAPLLARGAELRQNGSIVRTEADASMPTARARFQRHLEAQRPSPAPMPVPDRSSWKNEALLLFVILVWGLNFPTVKAVLAV